MDTAQTTASTRAAHAFLSAALATALVAGTLTGTGCKPKTPAPPTPGGAQGGGGDGQGAPMTGRAALMAKLPLKVDGGRVDMGIVLPCVQELRRTVALRNTSDRPVEVLNYASNCGCLKATLLGDMRIGPGESRDLELIAYPQGNGNRSNLVEFGALGGMAASVRVDYRIAGAPYSIPKVGEHSRAAKPEAIDFKIVSEVPKPFKVLAIEPMVGEIVHADGPEALVRLSSFEIEQFAASPAGAKHPDMLRSPDGQLVRALITVRTDDPTCPEIELTIDFVP